MRVAYQFEVFKYLKCVTK